MNKQETAAMLGVSERTVAAHVTAGRLGVRYVKGKTRDVADYDEAEVKALAETLNSATPNRETLNREIVQAKPVNRETGNHETGIVKRSNFLPQTVNRESGNSMVQGFTIMQDEQLERLVAAFQTKDKPLLTFTEAAQFTGISEKLLRDAAKEGALKARKIGRAQRIRQVDLSSWIDGQFA